MVDLEKDPEQVAEIARKCTTAEIGCVECKSIVSAKIAGALEPFRLRRAELAARPDYIREVLNDGANRARAIAREVLREAKGRIGLD